MSKRKSSESSPLPKALAKRFNLKDNGRWRKAPSVRGPHKFFWVNLDLDGERVTICHHLLSGDLILSKEVLETPYMRHKKLNHRMTSYSPNGVDLVEECTECEMRFMHNPAFAYAVTLDPKPKTRREHV